MDEKFAFSAGRKIPAKTDTKTVFNDINVMFAVVIFGVMDKTPVRMDFTIAYRRSIAYG